MDLYGLSGTAYPLTEGNYAGRSTSRRVTPHKLSGRNVFCLVSQIAAPVALTLSVAPKMEVFVFFHGALSDNSIAVVAVVACSLEEKHSL